MPIEIERKFLVKGEAWRALAEWEGQPIRQGYICRDPQRTVRVRVYGKKGFLTIKTASTGILRDEFEYGIPFDQACELLERVCIHPLIEKTRYRILWGEFVIEVDEFSNENAGLIIAEIELPDEHTALKIPYWLGKDVSQDVRYRNSQLAIKPYGSWEIKDRL